MRSICLGIIATLFASASLNAQVHKEEIEYLQSIFGMEKKTIVAKFIQLEGEAEASFWTLYDKYETERKQLGQKRIELLGIYVKNYDSLTDDKIDKLVSNMIKQNKALNKLVGSYYKKIKKSLGSKPAAQFIQLESYFGSIIRLNIMENIPVLGELEITNDD